MKKRIFSLIMVVALMVSFCAITANAVVYMNYDFSDPDFNVNDGNLNKLTSVPESVYWVSEVDDGAYYLHKDAGVTGSKNDIQQSFYFPNVVPLEDRTERSGASYNADPEKRYYLMSDTSKEFILEYDYMIPDMSMFKESTELLNASYAYSDIYFNGFRLSWNLYPNRFKTGSGGAARQAYFNQIFKDATGVADLDAFEGRWMTIAHHFWYDDTLPHVENLKKDLTAKYTNWKCDVYIKEKGADEWAVALMDHAVNIHNNTTSDYVRFYCYPQYALDMKIDNLRMYSGTELMANEVVNDLNVITSANEVAAGEITATGTVATTVPTEGLRKIMVAYDKTGKMIDFKAGTQNLVLGSNEVSDTIELDDNEATAVADGGYVGLYLWDGMLPYINAVEIK